MQIKRAGLVFEPVIITLETQEELEAVYNALSVTAPQDVAAGTEAVIELEKRLEEEAAAGW